METSSWHPVELWRIVMAPKAFSIDLIGLHDQQYNNHGAQLKAIASTSQHILYFIKKNTAQVVNEIHRLLFSKRNCCFYVCDQCFLRCFVFELLKRSLKIF